MSERGLNSRGVGFAGATSTGSLRLTVKVREDAMYGVATLTRRRVLGLTDAEKSDILEVERDACSKSTTCLYL